MNSATQTIKDIAAIVSDKEQKDWTAEELRKIGQLVNYTDEEFETDEELLESIHNITGLIVRTAGNAIIEGAWCDCNVESAEANYNLQNICNVAFSKIDTWTEYPDTMATNEDLVEIIKSGKEFQKETGLDFELFSTPLIATAEALEDDRQTFLVEKLRSEDFDSDDLPTLLEVIKFNPMKGELIGTFAGEIIVIPESAKKSLLHHEQVDAQLYYDTSKQEFTTF